MGMNRTGKVQTACLARVYWDDFLHVVLNIGTPICGLVVLRPTKKTTIILRLETLFAPLITIILSTVTVALAKTVYIIVTITLLVTL